MKNVLMALMLIGSIYQSANAQKRYKSLDWAMHPMLHEVDEKYDNESAVIIQDNRYVQNFKNFVEEMCFFTTHKIIRVNSDAGIEKFNKVYIRIRPGETLLELEVRTIAPDSTVKNFNKNNLKQLSNANGYGNFKIFAVEGIVKGGEIEYTYTVSRNFQYFGREVFQRDVPIMEANFELINPAGYNFDTKSYNGFPDSVEDDDVLKIYASDIPAIAEEELSAYQSQLMRVDYRFKNYMGGISPITWDRIAENLFERFYSVKGGIQAEKFVKEHNLRDLNQSEQIARIEQIFKESFSMKRSYEDEYSDPIQVFKKHVGNEYGITKAYIKAFEKLRIDFNLVFSTNRFNGRIDPSFAHSMDINEVFFYFPSHQKYIDPSMRNLRFGPAPSQIEGNYGLYIQFGWSTTGFLRYQRQVREDIKVLGPEFNNLGVTATMKIDHELGMANVNLERHFQGHQAFMLRSIYAGDESPDHSEFKNEVIASGIEDANFVSFRTENEDLNESANIDSHFRVFSSFTSESLAQQAGQDILIAVGKLIGRQSEMYEVKERKTDISLDFMKRYTHKLKIVIPEGYVCKGLDQLNISNSVEVDETTVMNFDSSYTYEGNELNILVHENYETLSLDKFKYDEFRAVINSAADFNKIILVLEPTTNE